MIDVFIASQGGGKTLTSIHYVFEPVETTIIEDGKEKLVKIPRHRLYKRLITNVGGFKPDLFRTLSGNDEIEIKHYDRYLHKEDLIIIFDEQMKEKEKPQEERTPTLFIYDECQFGLSTFSVAKDNIQNCEFISNFFSLQRHYGPCDFLLMTQSRDKIHKKYLGLDFRLFIGLEYAKKKDPENDIVFDLYDCEGKEIITGGRNKINYKKSKMLKDKDGNEFSPFDLYVSGDGGRKPVKKKSFWFKYVYILAFIILVVIIAIGYTFVSLFSNIKQPIKADQNTTIIKEESKPKEIDYNLSIPPPNALNRYDENSTFHKYVKEPYNNIDSQIMHRVFVMDNIYYVGTQLLTLDDFKRMVEENVLFVISTQPVTKRSFYVNVLMHQSILNSFGIVKDFDSSNDRRVKTALKSGQ